MPRPRHIDVRIKEAQEKLEMLKDKKRLEEIKARIRRRQPGRRRRSM